jgi:ABC-2 type transport system permease protein/lipopolysaccharide transport system permease protein
MAQETIGVNPAASPPPVAPAAPNHGVDAVDSREPARELMFRRRLRLRDALREMVEFRGIILTLAERDLRARYKQAVLGAAWALVTPLMLMLVFSIVFTKFATVDTGGVPYPLFAYLGLIPWTFFSAAVLSGGSSLITNIPLLNKVYLPREVFPVSALAVAAVDAVLSVIVLIGIFAIEGFMPHIEVLYAPILLLVAVIFAMAATLAVSALLVYVRDLRHALPLILQLALFATPVAYGLSAIASSRPKVLIFSALNPLAPVIDGLRRTILHGQSPDWVALGVGATTATLGLYASYFLFKRLETGMADIA